MPYRHKVHSEDVDLLAETQQVNND
jgi:hypothetical protein